MSTNTTTRPATTEMAAAATGVAGARARDASAPLPVVYFLFSSYHFNCTNVYLQLNRLCVRPLPPPPYHHTTTKEARDADASRASGMFLFFLLFI
jgi:hypothetical protein